MRKILSSIQISSKRSSFTTGESGNNLLEVVSKDVTIDSIIITKAKPIKYLGIIIDDDDE